MAIPEHRRAFGDRIRELRKAKGLSQEQLAHEAALDRTYVSGIERGTRNVGLDNIYRLADALDVATAELF
jgi:transcriptional regulator with XRE-family HTH domain